MGNSYQKKKVEYKSCQKMLVSKDEEKNSMRESLNYAERIEEEERATRIRAAEKVLQDIADEYAVLRTQGLAPMRIESARLLLDSVPEGLTSLSFRESGVDQPIVALKEGARGSCIYGHVRLLRLPVRTCTCLCFVPQNDSSSTLCANCGHGSSWHKIEGGKNLEQPELSPSGISSKWNTAEQIHLLDMMSEEFDYEYDSDLESDASVYETRSQSRVVTSMTFPSTRVEGGGVHYSAPNKLGETIHAMNELHSRGYNDEEIEEYLQRDLFSQEH